LSQNFPSPIKNPRNHNGKFAFFGKNGVKRQDLVFGTPKRHILAWKNVFWCIDRQNRCSGLGGSELEKPPKNNSQPNEYLIGNFVYVGAKSPNWIVNQICTGVDIWDIVTPANFGSHRLRRFRMAVGQISACSID